MLAWAPGCRWGDADSHQSHFHRHARVHAVPDWHPVESACACLSRGLSCIFAAILFALPPVLRLPLTKLREGLTEGGRGYAGTLWRRFGANLVVVELAIAVVLLVAAGLLGKSFYRLLHVDIGFQPGHLATVGVQLPEVTYAKDPQIVVCGAPDREPHLGLPGVEWSACHGSARSRP